MSNAPKLDVSDEKESILKSDVLLISMSIKLENGTAGNWHGTVKFIKGEKTGEKSYFTYLLCDKAVEINSPYEKKD